MFQFASGYGLSKKYERLLVFKKAAARQLNVYFIGNFTHRSKVEKRCYLKMREPGSAIYEKVLKFPANKSVNLCCYLQSWKYFVAYSNDIRYLFTLREDYLSRARGVLIDIKRNITKSQSQIQGNGNKYHNRYKFVIIHVRLTDFSKVLPDRIFIQNSMKHFF